MGVSSRNENLPGVRAWFNTRSFALIAMSILLCGGIVGCKGGLDPGIAPGAFALSSPANGATGVSLTPTLTWTDAFGEMRYAVDIDDENTFSSPLVHQVTGIAAGTTSFVVPGGVLAGGTTYYWRVTATNLAGSTRASNAPFSFTVLGSPDWCINGTQTGAKLGSSAQSAGDVNGDGYSDFLAGEPCYENGDIYEGRVHLYLGSPLGPYEVEDWHPEGNRTRASLGHSVGTAGDVNGDGYDDILAGMWNTESPDDVGGVCLYYGGAEGPREEPDWFAEGVPGSYFGFSVGKAGDINRDGYGDFLVGAYHYSVTSCSYEGAAYLYYGSPEGPSQEPAWFYIGPDNCGTFGFSVAGAGDVNGDGWDDVIINAAACASSPGKSYLFYGSPDGLSHEPWLIRTTGQAEGCRQSADTAGDVNGDGLADIIVGEYHYPYVPVNLDDPPLPGRWGRVFVYYGSTQGISTTPNWTAEYWQSEQEIFFGSTVGSAGDVNGDGYGDIFVGASGYPHNDTSGRVFVYTGSPDGLGEPGTPDNAYWAADIDQYYRHYGARRNIGSAGDANGDGRDDLVVGAFRHNDYAGRVCVY